MTKPSVNNICMIQEENISTLDDVSNIQEELSTTDEISSIQEDLNTTDDILNVKKEFSTVEIKKREYAKSMKDINKKQRKRKKIIEGYMKSNSLNSLECGHGVSVVLKSVKRVKFDEKLLVDYLEVEDDYFEAYKNANEKEQNTLSTMFEE